MYGEMKMKQESMFDSEKIAKFRDFLRVEEQRYARLMTTARDDRNPHKKEVFAVVSARHQQVLHTKSIFEDILEGKSVDYTI